MKIKNNFVFLMILFLYACHHIDDTQYEKIYFKNLNQVQEMQLQEAKTKQDNTLPVQIAQTPVVAPQNITKEAEIQPTKTEIVIKTPEKQTPKKRKVKIGELTIESDSMTFNKQTSMAVFLNNVKLKSKGVNLSCNELRSVNYRDNAEAIGNVRVFYPEQKVKILCNRVKYSKSMSEVQAFDNVVAEKILDNNEKINLYADEIKYDVNTGEIIATRANKKVKIKLKDIVAFSDKVIYNELTDELELTGNPFARKQESTFISSKINIDINKRIIKLKENIWAKLFYTDFEDIKKEVEVEKNKN
jgi:lipopolysaccharide export system protein LptA